MPLIIEPGDLAGQLFCRHPDTKQLLGFIQAMTFTVRQTGDQSTAWRVELFLTISGTASTQNEAIAFAQGAWAAIEAFGFRQQVSEPPTIVSSPVEKKRPYPVNPMKRRSPDQGV